MSGIAPDMVAANTPSFDVVDSALRQLGAADGATEAHGALCGLLCVLGPQANSVWAAGLDRVEAQDSPGYGEGEGVLADLAMSTAEALSAGQMAFAPLLPPDDRPLSYRAECLAEWCAGFMHGLGAAAGSVASREALDGEVTREIMADFAEIARASIDEDGSDPEGEAAYAELVEFVRVSVQLIFEELHDVRQRLVAASVH